MINSKKTTIFTIIGVCAALSSPYSSAVFAQEGDAIDADQFLKERPKSKQAPAATIEKSSELLDVEKSIAKAVLELEDKKILAQKIKLAKSMHKIRSTREQVDSAVTRVALSLPKYERKKFINSMSMMLNYNAIERISIDAMIETYTLKELTAMVEYYSKPEALSASKKMVFWAKKVQPEVSSMIDKALMRIKTGQ